MLESWRSVLPTKINHYYEPAVKGIYNQHRHYESAADFDEDGDWMSEELKQYKC